MKVVWNDFHDLPQIGEEVGLHALVKERSRWDCFIPVTSPSTRLGVVKEVYPTLWESTSEITITKNALDLLLTVLVGNLRHETTLHWAVHGLWLHDVASYCIHMHRHLCTKICKSCCDLCLLFLSNGCQPGLCSGYHPLPSCSFHCHRFTHVSGCSLLVIFGTLRVP